MSSEESSQRIAKFDGSDFAFWKTQIEDYLYQKDLYRPLLGKEKGMKKTEETDDWEVLDRKALGVVRLSLSKSVTHNIMKEKTTFDLMEALKKMYEQPSAANKVHLMKKLFNLTMPEGVSFMSHLSEFNATVDQLLSVDISFSDEVQALLILSQLPESWQGSVTAISNSAGKEKLKLSEVVSLILTEEVRRSSIDSSAPGTSGSALSFQQKGKAQGKGSQKKKSKGKSKGVQGNSQTRSNECWNCGQVGHFANACKAPKKNEQEAHVLDDALILALNSDAESWVVDSGASFHATANREVLLNYVAGDFGKVYLGNDQACSIVGRGDVQIAVNGSSWCLKDVRHVPKLRRNLISVGQLAAAGFTSTFTGDLWKVSRDTKVMAEGKKVGSLYLTSQGIGTLAVADSKADSSLWHCRLGHMSEKGMKVLQTNGKLPGLESVDFDICEDCIFGKQKRVSFQKGGRPPKAHKLELVHTDVWGPSRVRSLGGSYYFVTFIDDHSRKVWVYFMKQKSEVFEVFKKWKALVENETDLKLKRLRSDNGGEYELTEFKEFCGANGIRLERTPAGTPQLNGVAERMNRTLTERARSMRIHAGLPKCFWADAVSTAAYLINLGPSVPLNFGIPEEVWSGKEVNLSHLRVFGCVSYVHVNDEKRDKLDPKSVKCVFIGYGGDDFGYRFYDYTHKKIIRSRDVVFSERALYKDRDSKRNSGSTTLDGGPSKYFDVEDLTGDVRVEQDSCQEQVVASDGTVSEETDSDGVTSETEGDSPVAEVRRSTRVPKPNPKYLSSLDYLLLTDSGEPECYEEAVQVSESAKWKVAMQEEMDSLHSNGTWQLSQLPAGKQALHNKWVFRLKQESDGKKRYKARLVVKGFQQKEGIDFGEIFSPVVKHSTIRMVLNIVAAENLFLEQLDVKTAFLHGDLDEEIYMKQPVGFIVKGKEKMVCRLKKSLYGLKQAPRQWYKKFDGFMLQSGYHRCNADHCCYFKRFEASYIILLLYVDDMLVAGSCFQEINRLKQQLATVFAMKDLGAARQILGMRISRDMAQRTLRLSQAEYIERVLRRFNMQSAKAVGTPLGSHFRLSQGQSPKGDAEIDYMAKVPYASAIGSLMYAAVCTRPDISHAVGVVSRFASNPGKEHWEAVKWVMRYLRGSTDLPLCFGRSKLTVQGFVDADFAGDQDTRKSTTGYVFMVGSTAVSWVSRLQKIVTLSTTEAEYVAVTEAAKEMIWLNGFMEELGLKQEDGVLFCDSQSAIHLAKNPVFHARTKHIDLRYHFIRSLLEEGSLLLVKILGSKNPADMLTKPVTVDKLKLCSTSVGLHA